MGTSILDYYPAFPSNQNILIEQSVVLNYLGIMNTKALGLICISSVSKIALYKYDMARKGLVKQKKNSVDFSSLTFGL